MTASLSLTDKQIEQYFATLGVTPNAASLATLNTIIARHISRFTFASISPILGDPMPLDLQSVYDRLITRKRGGYCYEHNGLLFHILSRIGYDLIPVMARVVYHLDHPYVHAPLTHRTNLVRIDGELYLCEAGFSGFAQRHCIRLSDDEADAQARVVQGSAGDWHYQCKRQHGYHSMFRFDLGPVEDADFELGHFWSHRHPNAVFVNNVVASRIHSDHVVSLRNTMLVHEPLLGHGKVDEITDADQLRQILAEIFDILVTHTEADRLLDRAAKAASRPTGPTVTEDE